MSRGWKQQVLDDTRVKVRNKRQAETIQEYAYISLQHPALIPFLLKKLNITEQEYELMLNVQHRLTLTNRTNVSVVLSAQNGSHLAHVPHSHFPFVLGGTYYIEATDAELEPFNCRTPLAYSHEVYGEDYKHFMGYLKAHLENCKTLAEYHSHNLMPKFEAGWLRSRQRLLTSPVQKCIRKNFKLLPYDDATAAAMMRLKLNGYL